MHRPCRRRCSSGVPAAYGFSERRHTCGLGAAARRRAAGAAGVQRSATHDGGAGAELRARVSSQAVCNVQRKRCAVRTLFVTRERVRKKSRVLNTKAVLHHM